MPRLYNDGFDDEYDDGYPADPQPIICQHGDELAHCERCDEEIEAQGGIDKCLNCGRYKYGNQLDKDQVCKIGCVNPNEY